MRLKRGTFFAVAFAIACGGQDADTGRPAVAPGSPFAIIRDSSASDTASDSTARQDSIASETAAPKAPAFRTIRGHVVMGTDELSFRPCGSRDVSLVLPRGVTRGMIAQRYRFEAPSPLTPVFFEFSARTIDSVVTVADYSYKRVMIVDRVLEATKAPSNCPRPSRGSFIESR